MKRRWKVLGAVLVILAVMLGVNAFSTSNQTKQAEASADGGQILNLSTGDVQVTDSGPSTGQPVVLIHGYGASLHWFDRIEPLLAQNHRVIRIDLLGFGGSEKPESGYSIPEQGALVAEAMNELDVDGALVAGNSMGGMVAVSLAEQASQLVDRIVLIDIAPSTDGYGPGLPFLAKLGYVPVIGQASWRVAPDFAIRDGLDDAFAPGYDTADGFDDSDQPVEDFRAMTYTSFDEARSEADAYVDELPLDERLRQAPVPLLAIFGAEDQIFDADESLAAYQAVPGAETELVEGAGHAPQVEQPETVAELIESFSLNAEAPDERRRRNNNDE